MAPLACRFTRIAQAPGRLNTTRRNVIGRKPGAAMTLERYRHSLLTSSTKSRLHATHGVEKLRVDAPESFSTRHNFHRLSHSEVLSRRRRRLMQLDNIAASPEPNHGQVWSLHHACAPVGAFETRSLMNAVCRGVRVAFAPATTYIHPYREARERRC